MINNYRLYRVVVTSNESNTTLLEAEKRYFQQCTGLNTTYTYAKATNRNFNIRKGDKVGFYVKLYGRVAHKFLSAVTGTLKRTAISAYGNCQLGLSEYTLVTTMKYHPDVPLFGLSVNATISGPGWGAQYKRRAPGAPIVVDKAAVEAVLKNYPITVI